MGKYFGTDGFRGEANVTLTAEKAFKVGRYLGYYYGTKHPDSAAQIAIGKDTRRSSYMLEDALCAGLTSSGADVYLLHVTTTPPVSMRYLPHRNMMWSPSTTSPFSSTAMQRSASPS